MPAMTTVANAIAMARIQPGSASVEVVIPLRLLREVRLASALLNQLVHVRVAVGSATLIRRYEPGMVVLGGECFQSTFFELAARARSGDRRRGPRRRRISARRVVVGCRGIDTGASLWIDVLTA